MRRSYQSIVSLMQQIVRGLVFGWSLERKSLLFLGFALVIPIGLAFWFIVAVIAERLVMQTTRQAARDYARSVVAWRHVDRRTAGGADRVLPEKPAYFFPDVLAIMRTELVDNPDYLYEFLMLDNAPQHADLMHAELPASPTEQELLEKLREQFRGRDANQETSENSSREELTPSSTVAGQKGPPPFPIISEENLFRDDGPVFPASDTNMRYAAETPPEGWYVYYHAVNFSKSCLQCHAPFQGLGADKIPFRVVKVLLPYRQTQVATPTTLAWMISVAMLTVAGTLLVVHWVLRHLVLNPLQHLRTVSDEISRGRTDLRVNIDTGDEFNELGHAFNRMLRHMTEGQGKLQKLNSELDSKVDELAQANLHLFEANRLKSDFLANMSHELRTPLNSIIGFSDVLHDISSLTEKQRRYAANIQNSGRRLLDMINDILDLAKVEAGKMKVTPTAFALGPLVSAQCDMLRSLIDEKNMDLQIVTDPSLQEVFQDQPKLQQILTNLLSNAIKFTPDGGLVTVSIGKLSAHYFHLTVSDTGVGIPETDFEIIFEKFRQSNAVLQNDGLTRQHSGTGLGLSIVKELCKLLGGEVRLTSQLGTGSTFQVILPIHFEQVASSELAIAQPTI